MTPKLKNYLVITNLSITVTLVLTFVTIGPWTVYSQFYILFIFQIFQFILYTVLSYVFISYFKDQYRVLCIRLKSNNPSLIHIIIAASDIILALWLHFSYVWACSYINVNIDDYDDNSTFMNCINVIITANMILVAMHIFQALIEIVCCIISLTKCNKTQNEHKVVVKNEQGEKQEQSFDVSSEGIDNVGI